MTDKMGTMFECLRRASEDKNVGWVNTDIGAEFCSVGIEHGSPAPYNLSRQWFNDHHISKKKFKRKDVSVIVLYSWLKKMKAQ